MEQKIITASRACELNSKIVEMIKEGWAPVGSHHVAEVHHQMRFSGMQHKDTVIESEYSQTMKKD